MSIILTGGAGYIGTHTCVTLMASGQDIVIVDNFVNSCPAAIKRVARITGVEPKCYDIDVRDESALRQVFAEHSIDTVIHLAGLKAVGESVQKPLEYYDCNLNSTLTLLNVMREFGCKRLVFSSSATVYTGDAKMPLTENSPTGGCSSPYGWTKYMNEVILKTAATADPELSIALLRYFNPVGAHESGLIGEMPNGIPNNLMPLILRAATGKMPKLNVYGNDYPTRDGTCIRDYIHIMDLARGHAAACKYLETHPGVSVFNLGTGNGVSVLEIIHAFMDVTGVKIPYEIAPRRQGDNAITYADCTLAEMKLGWRAQKSVADMCANAWKWQQDNPNGYTDRTD